MRKELDEESEGLCSPARLGGMLGFELDRTASNSNTPKYGEINAKTP